MVVATAAPTMEVWAVATMAAAKNIAAAVVAVLAAGWAAAAMATRATAAVGGYAASAPTGGAAVRRLGGAPRRPSSRRGPSKPAKGRVRPSSPPSSRRAGLLYISRFP